MVNIVLGVTGSVAGIKVAELLQLLKDRGAAVRIVCSKHGAVFIEQPQHGQAPPVYYTDSDDYAQVLMKAERCVVDTATTDVGAATPQASNTGGEGPGPKRQKKVHTGSTAEHGDCVASTAAGVPLHVELAEWGEVLLIAPLSANTMAKLAMGLCDNLVSRLYRCWDSSKPVLVAPAMNTKMWDHAATGRHVQALRGMRVAVLPPVSKTLACGDVGVGAMASVGDVVAATLVLAGVEMDGAPPADSMVGKPVV